MALHSINTLCNYICFTFRSWLDLLVILLALWISISRFLELAMSLLDFSPWIPLGTFSICIVKSSNHFKTIDPGLQISLASKNIWKVFRSYSELLSKFGEISFQEYVSDGISHPVYYGDLVYKLRRIKGAASFVSSGSKIVKHIRRRKYEPVIIERNNSLVLGPSTALYRSVLDHCTLANSVMRTIWPLWLLVGTASALGPELAFRWVQHSLLWRILIHVYNFVICYFYYLIFLWPLRFGWL